MKGNQTSARKCYAVATKANGKAQAVTMICQAEGIVFHIKDTPLVTPAMRLSDLDPKDEQGEKKAELVEGLESIKLDALLPNETVQIRLKLKGNV